MSLTLRSKSQIISDFLTVLLAELGLNDINPASVMTTIAEASAQEDFEQYYRMLSIIRNYNIDTTSGADLDIRAFEYGLTRKQALNATGVIDILRPEGFEKVATTIYSGLQAPIQGNTTINVNDASNPLIGTSGTLIIGRGTQNVEEVTYSVAPVNNTNYFTFTLDVGLANNHGLDETVILKQGSDEIILAGTVVRVPAAGTSQEILFNIDQDVTLLSGEDVLSDVEVTAQEPGTRSNIPIKAIEGEEAFPSPPFIGARAENNTKFSTGRDLETDQQLRDRIKNHIQSLSRGVKEAILNAIVGLVDPDTAKRVVSANVILPVSVEEVVDVYIDDGTGFEPSFEFQGFEEIITSATGGETRLQLDIIPQVKAQLESNIAEPYNFSTGTKTLTYNVGTLSETLTFFTADFEFPESVTAEQIVREINDKANLIEARTSQQGKQVVITAKEDENEEIQITGGNANDILGFPTDLRQTIYLYVNEQLLSKDGSTAFVDAGNQETYNFTSLVGPWELTVVVDNKTANPQTVTFVAGDFLLPSQATADEVVAVINQQLAGATASLIASNTGIRLTSNTERSSSSAIQITGGNVNTLLNFPTTLIQGTEGDFTFNRFTGTIELDSPLQSGDRVTVGSRLTRAFLRATAAEFYSIVSGETLVLDIDGSGDQTVTFGSTGNFSAQQVADLINEQLEGGTASVQQIESVNYLIISTNTQDEASGSIELDSSSTGNGPFGFPEDTLVTNQRPHKAFAVNTLAGPYEFVETANLIVVLDNTPQTKTFNIVMDFDGEVTTANTVTNFFNLNFNVIFEEDDELNDFYLVMKSGANTESGVVETVSDQGGDTFRYEFNALPANLADYAIGDMIQADGATEIGNDGYFLITGISTAGNGYVEVINIAGDAATGEAITLNLYQRRQVTDYSTISGEITIGSGFTNIPQVGDTFIVLPSTIQNLVDYMNNTKITTISTRGLVEGVEGNSRIQISSSLEGSDGYVRVTGGKANTLLGFDTDAVRGLEAYAYYTGLLKRVHQTIYGDDRDRVTYPGVGAAGIHFDIQAPTVQEVSFTLDVELNAGVSISQVEDEVKSAITGYINGLGVGEDVVIEEVRCRVIQIDNIIDVAVTSTTAQKIPIADNEVARTRDSLIIIG